MASESAPNRTSVAMIWLRFMPSSYVTIPRMDRLRLWHRFLCEKHIYFVLWVAAGLWVLIHFNVYNWGLPLTDDQGHLLRR